MLDPSGMYPNGFHPTKINRNRNFKGTAKAYTRTQRRPVYYFIDFGLSRQYSSRDVTDEPLRGGDKSAPEHQRGMRCNPFHTDIYYIGNLVREEFIKVSDCLSRRKLTRLMSSSLLEIPWFQIHGGFDQLDDPRGASEATSD
jgi:hypothetical protein